MKMGRCITERSEVLTTVLIVMPVAYRTKLRNAPHLCN